MTRSTHNALLVFIIGLAALLSHSIAHANPLGTCTVNTPEGPVSQSGVTEQFCIDEMSGGGAYTWTPDSSGSGDRHLLLCDGTWTFEGAIHCDGNLQSVDAHTTELWLNGGWDADGFAEGFSMIIMLFIAGLGIGLVISVIRKAKGA